MGEAWKEKLTALQKNYVPNAMYSGGQKEGTLSLLQNKFVEGKTVIYVCKNKSCRLPVEKVADAMSQII